MTENPTTIGAGFRSKFCVMLLVLATVSDFGRGQTFPHSCVQTGYYTTNSTYSASLNATLSALSSNTSEYGFYSASLGQGGDRAHAVALCRADQSIVQCRSCVEDTAIDVVRLCPNQTQAIEWSDVCTVHYSNRPINGLVQSNIGESDVPNPGQVSNPQQFQQDRTALMDHLRAQAANGSSLLKVAAGVWNTSNSEERLYALVQCFPILSWEECDGCLIEATQKLPPNAIGGRKLLPSCSIRYELYLFYNEARLRELNVPPLQFPDSPPGNIS